MRQNFPIFPPFWFVFLLAQIHYFSFQLVTVTHMVRKVSVVMLMVIASVENILKELDVTCARKDCIISPSVKV